MLGVIRMRWQELLEPNKMVRQQERKERHKMGEQQVQQERHKKDEQQEQQVPSMTNQRSGAERTKISDD